MIKSYKIYVRRMNNRNEFNLISFHIKTLNFMINNLISNIQNDFI